MSAFTDKIEYLMAKNGKTKTQFLRDMNLGSSTFQRWKERGNLPRSIYIHSIAEYFGVSPEYLTQEDDQTPVEKMVEDIVRQVKEEIKTPTADISSERQKIIDMLSDVDESRLQEIKSYLEYLASKGK